MIVDPRGTQTAQIPMAFPRLSAENHRAITAGATTDMRLIPAPSMNRLASMASNPRLRAPQPAPMTRERMAIIPVSRYPSL